MASSIFDSDGFNRIVQGNLPLGKTRSDSEKKVIEISRKVIKEIRDSGLQPDQSGKLNKFILSLNKIATELDPTQQKTLQTYILTIDIIESLEKSQDPDIHNLRSHPFIGKLVNLLRTGECKDYEAFSKELNDFLILLTERANNIKTPEERTAIHHLMSLCIKAIDSIEHRTPPNRNKILQANADTLARKLNTKAFELKPIYQTLIKYKPGYINRRTDIGTITPKITSFLNDLSANLDKADIPKEELMAIYHAAKTIESDLSKTEHSVKFPLQVLEDRLGIKSAQPAPPAVAPAQGSSKMNPGDLTTIRKLSKEIVDLRVTIGDAASYKFSARYKTYINPENTKKGSASMLAAASQAKALGKKYNECPEAIINLGKAVLRDKSGQCDHMAAAVIAKIVEHIRNGGQWNSTVELAGNGGHAFILINRNVSWEGVVIIDTWLGSIGVHSNYQSEIPTPQDGVISDQNDVYRFARAFGAQEGAIQISLRLTPEQLKDLANK